MISSAAIIKLEAQASIAWAVFQSGNYEQLGGLIIRCINIFVENQPEREPV